MAWTLLLTRRHTVTGLRLQVEGGRRVGGAANVVGCHADDGRDLRFGRVLLGVADAHRMVAGVEDERADFVAAVEGAAGVHGGGGVSWSNG